MPSCMRCGLDTLPGANYCPSCGERTQETCRVCSTPTVLGSRFCTNCGNSLTNEPGSSDSSFSRTATEVPPKSRVCPRCYRKNDPEAGYCFSCGLPLDTEDSSRSGPLGTIPAFAEGAPAGFWIRVVASIIDAIILFVVFAVLWSIVSGQSPSDYWESSETGAGDFFSLALYLLYYTVAIATWSTTIGKRLFRLYVVRVDGSKVGAGRALARYFAYFLSIITFGIGFLVVALRQDKRGLHDLVCDTVVIKR